MKKRFPVTGPAVDPICCDGGGDGRLIEELPGAADTFRPHLIMGGEVEAIKEAVCDTQGEEDTMPLLWHLGEVETIGK